MLYYYYEIDSKTAQYVFMDPGNNSETVGRLAVTVDSTVMSDGSKLSFTSRNTNTYSYWSRSYYES